MSCEIALVNCSQLAITNTDWTLHPQIPLLPILIMMKKELSLNKPKPFDDDLPLKTNAPMPAVKTWQYISTRTYTSAPMRLVRPYRHH
ncbi:unnamed protein product [Heligmosomoides polygyrus]|uniref:Uncharacterized protein n=1 Tax=Heligmosomoides polygyrus TaxID=6339 RepID=A0A183FE64_HELPZ|nr:unnamed protein product [Heligmosomoides polygyrus]